MLNLKYQAERPIYLTSDTHFGHKKMAELRGFGTDVEEHDEWVIDSWNDVVGDSVKRPLIFHLGDFAFANQERIHSLLSKLWGDIYFIPGNHDKVNNFKGLAGLELMSSLEEISYENQNGEKMRITLCHFPLAAWNHSDHGSYHFHGHLHGNTEHHWCAPYEGAGTRIDIGVDCSKRLGFERLSPVPLEEVLRVGRI